MMSSPREAGRGAAEGGVPVPHHLGPAPLWERFFAGHEGRFAPARPSPRAARTRARDVGACPMTFVGQLM
jgi:hypothetical protein